ncbi:MAG: DUF4918 family protein [Desulfovibrionaceae bacterium]|nr:DUF4918 family protein [Desulfovibrionaceae bacterium]
MPTFAESVIAFNNALQFDGALPQGIGVMNPFRENPDALRASSAFYLKYYNDANARIMLLGINPGRFGAGLTGVPFTDPKRLKAECAVDCYAGAQAHEPSSVFIYEMIRQYGGVKAFYSQVYINSICPLGFVEKRPDGKEVNYNYYDNNALTEAARPFMLECLRRQLDFGIRREVCFVLGTGKNMQFISRLNREYGFFEKLIPLEHPRYIIQYKSRQTQHYINKYLELIKQYADGAAL